MKNIPILGKFLVVMAVFGAFTLGGVVYTTGQMHRINAGYGVLLDHHSKAALMLARANRAMQTSRASIAELMISKSEEGNRRAASDLKTAEDTFSQNIDQAVAALPDESAIKQLRTAGLTVIQQDCARAVSSGLHAADASAIVAAQSIYEETCQGRFLPLTAQFKRVTDGVVAASQKDGDRLTDITNGTIATTYGVILGGLAVVTLMAVMMIRALISKPIESLNRVMERLAGGDNAVDVVSDGRRDEVGAMARTVQVFKNAAIDKVRLEGEAGAQRAAAEGHRVQSEAERSRHADELSNVVDGVAGGLAKLAEGDLTHRLNTAFSPEYEALRRDFNAAMEKMLETMKVVAANAQAIHSGSGEISTAADDLSRRTEQQAASLEETAAALDQITATVRKTADGAMHARDVVGAAKGDAERSGQIVHGAVEAMSGIEQSSRQIGQIIGVIDEIAFQTNLLALNAGVEAARAGDAGRGFAVVASEVRALAQRSAEAAKEIKTLISASGQQVASGVDLVGEAGRALGRIVTQVAEINDVVGGIAASAQEQATALHQVNTAVNQMDQVTQQNAAMVEQTTAASHSLAHEAQELSRLITRFEVGRTASGAPARRPAPAPAAPPRSAPAAPPRAVAMKTVGGGGAAPRPQAAPAEEGWEEF